MIETEWRVLEAIAIGICGLFWRCGRKTKVPAIPLALILVAQAPVPSLSS